MGASELWRGLVWGGYEESQLDQDTYLPSSELMIYNSLTQTWTSKKTTGEVPTKCSGAGAAVLGDVMYVVAGFHKIMITVNALREVNAVGWMSDSDEEQLVLCLNTIRHDGERRLESLDLLLAALGKAVKRAYRRLCLGPLQRPTRAHVPPTGPASPCHCHCSQSHHRVCPPGSQPNQRHDYFSSWTPPTFDNPHR